MPATKNTVRKLKSQQDPTLNHNEVKRLAEKLGLALCADTETVQLITLLLQHLWHVREDGNAFFCALHAIESQLFIVLPEGDEARRAFRTDAFKNRGKILMWPNERKGVA